MPDAPANSVADRKRNHDSRHRAEVHEVVATADRHESEQACGWTQSALRLL
jgi:hypothetical protein